MDQREIEEVITMHYVRVCLILSILASLLAYTSFSYAAAQLPVQAFASLPDVSRTTISPDGTKVASIIRIDTDKFKGSAVSIYDFASKKATLHATTDNSKYILTRLGWANNNTLLISAMFPSQIYGIQINQNALLNLDTATGKVKSAISTSLLKKNLRKNNWVPTRQNNIIDYLKDDPEHILLSLRMTKNVAYGVMKLNLKTGRLKEVHYPKSDVYNWVTDRQQRIRIAEYFKGTTNKILAKNIDSKKWRTLWEYESLSEDVVEPLGFDADPNILYINAYHEDRLAIFTVNLADPKLERTLIYADPDYDVTGRLIYSKKNQRVVGIIHSGSANFTYWDEEYNGMQKSLDKALPNTDNFLSSISDDETKLVVLSTSDTDSGTYYLWDRTTSTVSPLAHRYSALDPKLMIAKEKISYTARDGVNIEAYLTQPNKDQPQPTIIFPHGGPISYNGKGFDYWTQFFANRGYTVLQMNFRGSSGYGYDFMKRGLKKWGLEMQNDVEDGTRWLIEQSIADPNKICVVGASYGGYAALMEAANNPDLYQCVVSFAGVTDLPYLVFSQRQFTNRKVVREQIGYNTKSLRERSPISRAKDIDIPILLVQGTKDRRVKPAHGRRMNKRLAKAGKDVTYIEQEGGNHYLSNQDHRLQFFTETDNFLKQHLN